MNLSGRNLYIFGGALAIVFLLTLWKLPQWQRRAYHESLPADIYQKLEPKDRVQHEKNAADIENSTRLTIAQIVGGLVLLAGLYFTYQNVKTTQENLRVTEEGKLTDRFSKAVELLGNDRLNVRLGGIYALERIARDSQKDHWTVMEVLTAFVRDNSDKRLEGQKNYRPREDVQAVMTIIGRRKWTATETQKLDLSATILADCKLVGANLKGANLVAANLMRADLSGANLHSASLGAADLANASLRGTDLREAKLSNANLREATFISLEGPLTSLGPAIIPTLLDAADLSWSDLSGAALNGVSLRQTDFSNANLTKTNLRWSNFLLADFRNADLTETVFLTDESLTVEQIVVAKNYEKAVFSPEFEAALQDWKARKS